MAEQYLLDDLEKNPYLLGKFMLKIMYYINKKSIHRNKYKYYFHRISNSKPTAFEYLSNRRLICVKARSRTEALWLLQFLRIFFDRRVFSLYTEGILLSSHTIRDWFNKLSVYYGSYESFDILDKPLIDPNKINSYFAENNYFDAQVCYDFHSILNIIRDIDLIKFNNIDYNILKIIRKYGIKNKAPLYLAKPGVQFY